MQSIAPAIFDNYLIKTPSCAWLGRCEFNVYHPQRTKDAFFALTWAFKLARMYRLTDYHVRCHSSYHHDFWSKNTFHDSKSSSKLLCLVEWGPGPWLVLWAQIRCFGWVLNQLTNQITITNDRNLLKTICAVQHKAQNCSYRPCLQFCLFNIDRLSVLSSFSYHSNILNYIGICYPLFRSSTNYLRLFSCLQQLQLQRCLVLNLHERKDHESTFNTFCCSGICLSIGSQQGNAGGVGTTIV